MKGRIMGQIPEDATHWDSGDWIEWHRTPSGHDSRLCDAAAEDPRAKLLALHANLLRSAKGFYQLSGQHLNIYDQIAQVHAAIFCDLPLEGPGSYAESTGIEVVHLAPFSSEGTVEIDLSKHFATLIVVRINNDFSSEARMIPRSSMQTAGVGSFKLPWESLPYKF
ncbi:MAG: hypothetical protein ABJU19_18160 [Roseobacter sp.]